MTSFFNQAWNLIRGKSKISENEEKEALKLLAAQANSNLKTDILVKKEVTSSESNCNCSVGNLQQTICSSEGCNPIVSTCCSIIVPPEFNTVNIFLGAFQQLSFSTECLSCINEECLLPSTADSPCGGVITGFIRANSVRVVGAIKYNVNLFGLNEGIIMFPNFITSGLSYLCCSDSVCMDQTICLLPEGSTVCPNFSQTIGSAVIERITNIPCGVDPDGGGRLVTLRVTFTIPSCSGAPAGFIGVFASPSTVCAQGTGGNQQSFIGGYLVDSNGTPVSGATVTFTVDDPDRGSVSPTSTTTGTTGFFSTVFTAGTETGPAVITISSGDAETTVTVNVIDCTP
ncbi:MAG: hypothetical protein AB6733_06585 [Clostridiaceae bacterium]